MDTREYFQKLSKTFQNSVIEQLEYINIKHLIIKNMEKTRV